MQIYCVFFVLVLSGKFSQCLMNITCVFFFFLLFSILLSYYRICVYILNLTS